MANNVINAVFSSSTITYTKPAYQYDYGMILKFSGIELPQAYEVHFSNTEFCGESISQIGDENGVTIPDEMFLSGSQIYAWTFLHTGEDDGETVCKTVISINKRAQPSDLEPTPVQQDAITQAIAALNVAVEQTAADVIAADASAQAAAGSAAEANGYADEAKGYAERAESAESEAEGYATRAETAESHAQGYAQTASDKASEASGYASDAQGYADSASSFASDAQGYANDAKGYSESASASASDASGYASSAYGSAQSASGYASDASSAKDLAVQAKDDAVGAKESAEGFASDASDSANEAKGYAEDAEESAQSVLGLTADATVDSNVGTPSVEVEVITESDHKNMSFAFHNIKGEQGDPGQSGLITDYIAEEKTPYLFRPSANGLANVISEKDELIGGTVAWNQIINENVPFISTGGTVSTTDQIGTFIASATNQQVYKQLGVIKDHKYFASATAKATTANANIYLRAGGVNSTEKFDSTNWKTIAIVFNTPLTGGASIGVGDGRDSGWDAIYVKDFMIIDLTQMFGSTIADYLYTLESGSAGAGVAKAKSWGYFLKDYYPYNSGTLQSVQTSAHVMRDADDNVIGNYPLDSDFVLRGTLKLDAQNNLYYDGDRYESDGTVTRKFGVIDLGSLTYGKSSIVTNGFVGLDVPSDFPLAPNVSAIPTNWMTSVGYAITSNVGLESASVDKAIGWRVSGSNKGIIIKDSAYATYYTNNDMESFKSAMSGKYLLYGMVAPTTESADPYSEYQIVSADGTEEYVDSRTVPIPVGHDTYYQQAVDVPQLPTADGSYRLALSKTGNTATASWEYVAQAEMKAQTNIPSGKYFSVGERLFVSTQAIAQGANIVVGTNCTETTLADALNTINS